jgi:hypothetical protein
MDVKQDEKAMVASEAVAKTQEVEKETAKSWTEKIDVWGKLVLGLATLWMAYTFQSAQLDQSTQLQRLQNEIAQNRDRVQQQHAADQININKIEVSMRLIEVLLKGSERERILALYLLRQVDPEKAQSITEIVARADESRVVRVKAIRLLGESGGANVHQALRSIRNDGATKEERQEAELAETNISGTLRSLLTAARVFHDQQQWKPSAEYYYNASRYIDKSAVEAAALEAAKSHFEHGGYREAAGAFNRLFAHL